MKMLYVGDRGYYNDSVLFFKKDFEGQSVKEIIKKIENNEINLSNNNYVLSVYTFNEIDDKFISFIREEIFDYPENKNFYFENEEIFYIDF